MTALSNYNRCNYSMLRWQNWGPDTLSWKSYKTLNYFNCHVIRPNTRTLLSLIKALLQSFVMCKYRCYPVRDNNDVRWGAVGTWRGKNELTILGHPQATRFSALYRTTSTDCLTVKEVAPSCWIQIFSPWKSSQSFKLATKNKNAHHTVILWLYENLLWNLQRLVPDR